MTIETNQPALKPKIGRPLKLDEELIKKLSGYIAKGSYAITACQCCGLAEKTFYDYINQGNRDIENNEETIFSQLVKSLKSAEAECEHALASMIKETALDKKEWLPAMTFLERRHPERWGRRDRLQVDENKQVQINVVVKHYQELPEPPEAIEGECREVPLIGQETPGPQS